MKRLLFILFTLLTLHSFAQQDTVYVKLRGIPGVYNMSKNAGGDSIIFYVAGVRHALSVGTPVDLTPFVRYVDTPNMLSSYATKQKVKADSTVLANAITSASGGGVTQFNSRTGAIVPQAVDYSSFYYPLSTNPAGYITSVPAQSWTSITGKPTFATVATTGSYNDLSNKPTIPTVPTVVSAFTNDVPYASLSKVQSDSTTLQSSINPAFINQSFDTSTRALTLTRIDGTSQSVVIPKGTANGTSGIAALSSSRTGDTVSVMGDNGTKTTFSVNSSDSATRVHNGDNISVLNNNANYITSSGAPVQSVAGKTGAVALAKSDVGLSNVDNTSDLSKPISTATQTALNLKANDSAVMHLSLNETASGNKQFNGNLGIRGLQPFPTEDVGLWSNVRGTGGSGGVLRAGQFYSNYTGTNAFVAGDFYASDSNNTNNYDHVVSVQGLTNHLGSGTINNAWSAKFSGVNNGGNITNAYGYYWGGWSGTGTYTHKYAFYSAGAEQSSLNGGLSVNGKFAFGVSDVLGTYQGLFAGVNPIYEYQNSGVTTAFMGTASVLFSGADGNDFGIMQNNATRSIDLGVNGVLGIKVEKTLTTLNNSIAIPTITNAVGDFVTRNPSTNQLQIRTSAQTLTDIGALSKSDSTIANRVTNLQNTKANDNNVIHPTGNETASSKWLNNSYIALGGELSDLGMTGLFDRNELTNADLRGTVTVTQYTSGAASDVSSLASALFDASGNFSAFPQTSGSSDSLKILIDLGANVPNYSAGYWQPFVAFRLPYDLFKNIKVEVSTDNSTWTTSNTPASWSFNSTSQVFFPTGYWMGAKDYCANLASTWRYIRFSFKNPSNTDPYVYISEIGMRHSSAPYARQYLLKAGDNIYGRINLNNKNTTMGYIDPSTGTFNGTFTGIFSGNASTATKLQTARNINGVPFDGTSNITVTDATKEPTITAGTTSQYWRGDKTWQNTLTLPISTATQTALDAKLDSSHKDTTEALGSLHYNIITSTYTQLTIDTASNTKSGIVRSDRVFGTDTLATQAYARTNALSQSFVDSIRNASFATLNFGLNKIDAGSSSITKNLVIDNNKSLFFSGQGNLYQNTITPMNFANGGIIFETNGDGAHGSIPNRPNLVLTPSGISIDGGNNIPTAKIEIKASSGAAGDAAIKIHTSPLMAIPEDAAIEKDSSGYINVTTGTVRKKLAYTSDIKNESLQYRDYANDSVAVVDGHLSQWDYYRTGNIVKTVVTLPVFTLSYIVDYTTGANDSTQFFLAYAKNNTPFTVDWGDGNTSDFTNTADSSGARTPTHKYTSNGTYIIKVIFSNPANIANVTTFYLNNYPYAAKVTKVVNLDKLTAATDIELNDAKSLDSMTYDFAYPSTLKTLSLSNIGIIKFTPTHNLPAGLTSLRLNNNNLTTTAVNNTLVWLDGQTFNAGAKTLNISGQAPFSPPSGAGLTAKTSLESKGWTITTD